MTQPITKELIDAATGAHFTGTLFEGAIPPVPSRPLAGTNLALPVTPLVADTLTFVGMITATLSPVPGGNHAFMRASVRVEKVAASGASHVRLRFRRDGVDTGGAAGGIDIPFHLDAIGVDFTANGSLAIRSQAPAPDPLTHNYEVWLTSVGGAATLEEGTLEVDFTPP